MGATNDIPLIFLALLHNNVPNVTTLVGGVSLRQQFVDLVFSADLAKETATKVQHLVSLQFIDRGRFQHIPIFVDGLLVKEGGVKNGYSGVVALLGKSFWSLLP